MKPTKLAFLLCLLVIFTACNKQKSKAPRYSETAPTTTPDGPSVTPVVPDVDQNPDQNQNQTDGELSSRYEGENLILIPGASSAGRIIIKNGDARRLYKRLAIKSKFVEMTASTKRATRVATHVRCTELECVFNINYKEGEVTANQDVGDKRRILFPSPRTFRGTNLTIHGLKKKAIVKIEGKDARKLFEMMKVPESSVNEDDKISMVKTGGGEAPLSCKQQKSSTDASEDTFSCKIVFHPGSGIVKGGNNEKEENSEP